MKKANIMLDELKKEHFCKLMQSEIDVNNFFVYYSCSRIINLKSLSDSSLLFLERSFPLVAASKSFVELDNKSFIHLFSSSKLAVDSDLQLFNAAYSWLNYKKAERSKYAKFILSRYCQLIALSPTITYILDENSHFVVRDETYKLMNEY